VNYLCAVKLTKRKTFRAVPPAPQHKDGHHILAVAALDLRIVEGGVDDRGPEIVEVMCPPSLCGRRAATQRLHGVDRGISAT